MEISMVAEPLKKGALDELHLAPSDVQGFRNGPLNPEGHSFEPWSWKDPTVHTLKDIAAAVSGRQGGIVGRWQDLTWFNFKQTKPERINCCLRDLCGCETATHDRWNYRFVGHELIWVPTEEYIPPLVPLPAIRRKPMTLADVNCPKFSRDKCTFDPRAGSDLPTCRLRPNTPNDTITLGSTAVVRSTATTKVRLVALYLTTRRLDRHDQLPGRTFDWKHQTLMWDNIEASFTKESLDKVIAGASEPPANATPEEINNLVNPQQLQTIASIVARLQKAGVLKRLILRGYADRWEAQRDDPVQLSERRAQFIADRLHKHYSLSFASSELLVIGCGVFGAPADPDPGWRVATVEVEKTTRPAAAPAAAPKDVFAQSITSWTYDEFYEEAQSRWFSTLVKHTETTEGKVVRDSAEMQTLRNEALQYIRLFQEVSRATLGGLDLDRMDSRSLRSIEQQVLGWNVLGAGRKDRLPELPCTKMKDRLANAGGPGEPIHETEPEQYICAIADMSEDRFTRSRPGETLQLGGLRVHFQELCPTLLT
jgi:hypothetical protein